MNPTRRLGGILVAAAMALSTVACGGEETEQQHQQTLRVGAIATGSAQEEKKRYEATARQLEEQLGTPVELVTSTDYFAIAEALRGERIDVAFLGSLSYVLIEGRADVEPVAVGVDAGGQPGYYSYLVTDKPDQVRGPADVRGKRLALASKLSTSGYLFPLDALTKAGIDPAKDTTLSQGGNHAANVLAVMSGQVDAAFVDSVEYESAVKSGKVDPDKVRKVWQSDRITGSPVVVRRALPEDRRASITRALLGLKGSADTPIGVEKSQKLIAAKASDYDPIRELADSAGLSVEDLRK